VSGLRSPFAVLDLMIAFKGADGRFLLMAVFLLDVEYLMIDPLGNRSTL
jgi:hypothetical protein